MNPDIEQITQAFDPEAWPAEPGNYVRGNPRGPVAMITLGSKQLPQQIAQTAGFEHVAVVGPCGTENIGLEKVVKNLIANPFVRFLILCGREAKGHFSGQTFQTFWTQGIEPGGRIMGSKGQRPIAKNISVEQAQRFRRQIELVDMVGCEDLTEISQAIEQCVARQLGPFGPGMTSTAATTVEARIPEHFNFDRGGFFIILLQRKEQRMLLEHYTNDGTLNLVMAGADAVALCFEAITREFVTQLDHAAYLGRELQRAELCLQHDLPFQQSGALGDWDLE